MKHVLQAAAAAALLIASGQAFAQAPAPAPGGEAPAPGAPALPGGPMGGAMGGAEAAADVTPDTVVAALNNTETEIGEVASVAAGATIEVVPLSDFTGPDAATIDAALTANEDQQDALRTAIEGNSTLMAYLTGESVSIEDVVGIDVDGTNILVFTQASADAGGAAGGGAEGGAMGGAGGAGGAAPPAAPAP